MNLLDLIVKIGVDDQASDRISGIGGKIKGGLATAAKAGAAAIAAGVAAAGAGAVALGKAALDSYAQYEQLAGGVDKLFGDASEAVKQHAQEAYRTSGMSANQYMEQATGFSAALIKSLGGDTKQAAELTDVAMRAMSDNVNVFGSNMEDVQNAFQGFAKGNYDMLDNLKIGYGGTKEEMQKLIADAAAATDAQEKLGLSVDGTSLSFDNIVKAIQVIQYEQGIAGTTSAEAGKTIEGSVNMAKAAWENLLTEIGKDDGDIGARIDELMTSIFGDGTEENLGVIGNIGPRIVQIVENVVDAIPMIIEKVTPYLEEIQVKFQEFIDEHQEELNAMAQMLWDGILQALSLSIQMSFAALGEFLSTLIVTFPEWGPQLLEAAVILFANIVQGIINTTVDVLNGVADLIGSAIAEAAGFDGDMLQAAQELWHNFCDGVDNMRSDVISGFWDIVDGSVAEVENFVNDMFDAGANLVSGLVNGISDNMWKVLDTITGGLNDAVNSALQFLGIASPSKLFRWVGDMTMEGMAEGIEDTAGKAERAMLDATEGIYGAASGDVMMSAKVTTSGGVQDEVAALRQEIRSLKMVLSIDGREFARATVGEMAEAMNDRIGRGRMVNA